MQKRIHHLYNYFFIFFRRVGEKSFEELLFEIFILRAIKTNDDVCYINKNIEMIIELPNGFFKYEDKFQIFKLFNNA